jgi:hypothetical protein
VEDFRREDWCGRGAVLSYEGMTPCDPNAHVPHSNVILSHNQRRTLRATSPTNAYSSGVGGGTAHEGGGYEDTRGGEMESGTLPACLTSSPLDLLLLVGVAITVEGFRVLGF